MIATPTLSISPEKITSFIAQAHQLDDHDAHPGSNRIGAVEALRVHADAPAWQEMATFIDGLDEIEQAEMVALMWLGRGDGEVDEWNDLREEAALLLNKRATAYLLAKPMLVDHLEEGLAALGYPAVHH